MSKGRNFGYSEQYETNKNSLERQTAALLAERKQLEGGYSGRQEYRAPINPVFQESAAITPIALTNMQSENKTKEVVSKLQEIIHLCRQEGALSNEEMREVVKVENEVLNYLQRTTGQSDIPAPRPPSPHISQPSQPLQPPQSYQPSIPFQSATKARTETTTINPQINQTWAKGPMETRTILSEDTLQIISHIERKALGEIINLQQERDNIKRERDIFAAELERLRYEFTRLAPGQPQPPLISKEAHREEQRFSRIDTGENERLREENQFLRQQNHLLKEDNQYLNSRLEALGHVASQQARQTQKSDNRSTYPDNLPKGNLIYGQYDSQIAVYENQLKRATVVINELRSRLANVPGLQELHDQGERIRVQTAELLHLKGGMRGIHGREAALIQELQEKLENQNRGKAAFFDELKSFKQKYVELQEENRALRKSKVSFDPVPRPLSNSPPKEHEGLSGRGIIKKKAGYLDDYEQTLNQLKKVLY